MKLQERMLYHSRVHIDRKIFLLVALVSFGGAIFCGTEVVLSFIGRTLCQTETCRIVETFSLFSRPVLSGFAAFYFLLQGLGALYVWRGNDSFLRPVILVAAMAIGAESILFLRQFVDYHLHCPFCLIVAAFTSVSAGIILLACKRLAVFGAIIGVAAAMILTPISLQSLSQASTKHIHRGSPTEKWILIYAPDCPHCHKVLSFCQNLKDIDLKLCPKDKALAFLQLLGIKGVPVLIVNRDGEKKILVGSGLILSYLKRQEKEAFPSSLLTPSGICEENRKCEPLNEKDLLPLTTPF